MKSLPTHSISPASQITAESFEPATRSSPWTTFQSLDFTGFPYPNDVMTEDYPGSMG